MRKAIIVYDKKDKQYEFLLRLISDSFSGRGIEAESLCIDSNDLKNEYAAFFKETEAAYICTLDMAGFWLDTLLGMPLYNILTAKQLHIIVKKEKLDYYRDKEFAWNLFFVIPEECERVKKKYPHILNIDEYPFFEMDKKNIISDSELNRETIKLVIDGFLRKVGGN